MSQKNNKITQFRVYCIKFVAILFKVIPLQALGSLIWIITAVRLSEEKSENALRFLLSLDSRIYSLAGHHAVEYGKGDHVKHRLTGYVNHFVNLALEYEGPYLDIGCAQGHIAGRIAEKTSYPVIGIDINSEQIDRARSRFNRANLTFVNGDATQVSLTVHPATIILSNVYEHIEKRHLFLTDLINKYQPSHLLFRVPNFERDWRIPLRRELGMQYFQDPTHTIEHTPIEFITEIESAGLYVQTIEYRWGEIWAVVGSMPVI
jgi:2-polyprenyl-3-methyl-5-hydroxy-6-metoxy-1,4-benzoquinol methylase